MMANTLRKADQSEIEVLANRDESQLFDRKSRLIKPEKLSQTMSSFANTDGGDLLVGAENDGTWHGFDSMEDANPILAVAAAQMQLEFYTTEFLQNPTDGSYGLLFSIDRHPSIVRSTSGKVYQRNGAQNNNLTGEHLESLKRSKGESRYELTKTTATIEELSNSETMIDFMIHGSTSAEPSEFLKKNMLTVDGNGTIAATLLFADLPQAQIGRAHV